MSNFEREDNIVARPSLFWLLTEGGRAITELGLSIPYRKFFASKSQGDGHPVLALPGFMATDSSTAPLRKYLENLGYPAYSWDLGRNTAKVEFLEILLAKIEEIYKEHGEQVSLIGWSLGGVFARQLAKAKPEMIRQVITLGSPFQGVHQPNNVAWVYNLVSGGKRIKDMDPVLFQNIPLPAPVPTTAIYTKEDGIVPWELCIEIEDEIHQNIQVRGSHLGLGVNHSVLDIIADRLLYSREDWAHFRPGHFVKDILFYPSL
ncbi:MAG: pimeloyl-ACP methyl ester carboxylesterase [Saprospiraceae bacterium]|jgi:pimeloyl-ACP methyl ester carboxylesterase